MLYPPHVPEHLQFAVGQEAFGLVPGLMMYATIWLREHNRVCDVLMQEHPEWNDERIYQTAKLILIGEYTLDTQIIYFQKKIRNKRHIHVVGHFILVPQWRF